MNVLVVPQHTNVTSVSIPQTVTSASFLALSDGQCDYCRYGESDVTCSYITLGMQVCHIRHVHPLVLFLALNPRHHARRETCVPRQCHQHQAAPHMPAAAQNLSIHVLCTKAHHAMYLFCCVSNIPITLPNCGLILCSKNPSISPSCSNNAILSTP